MAQYFEEKAEKKRNENIGIEDDFIDFIFQLFSDRIFRGQVQSFVVNTIPNNHYYLKPKKTKTIGKTN